MAPPKTAKTPTQLNHMRGEEPGTTFVWASNGKSNWPGRTLSLVEFNHVVFTCNLFLIPLVEQE